MLEKKQKIADYVIAFPIKEGEYAQTYRVKDNDGKNFFLKLIYCSKVHHSQFENNGSILELEIAKQQNHPNINSYHDSGKLVINGQPCIYIVYDYIVGETVAQKISREQGCSVYDAKSIVIGVLQGLQFLQSLPRTVLHNEITAQNVMLDISSNPPIPKIIDFGHARFLDQGTNPQARLELNPFYQAPEALNGVFSAQSDIFSVGALLYYLVYGVYPYFTDLPKDRTDKSKVLRIISEARSRPLRIPSISKFELDEQLINVMEKALAIDPEDRFSSVDEFIKAMKGEIQIEFEPGKKKRPSDDEQSDAPTVTIKKGNGFKDVAGMQSLKDQLQSDVIDLIRQPQQAKELGLSIPNGLLFYGPPGCGKTYFAEKFAEEAGFNYKYIKCSDVASPFIHGGQGKIAAIFDEARKNAPTILFFDEIDAMVKDRSKHNNVSESGEVNEFLTQLNNCGQDGVLVIGATNKPREIDEAALRAGRLEFKYYIPQPDAQTRAAIFEINLAKRRCDFGIDYERLAALTENYISADIKMIVDNAARLTFRRKEKKIKQSTIEEVIANTRPSISAEVLKKHEDIRDEFMGIKKEEPRRKIGF